MLCCVQGEELSDVLIYLVRLADRCDVDLGAAVRDKMRKNGEKYPVDKVCSLCSEEEGIIYASFFLEQEEISFFLSFFVLVLLSRPRARVTSIQTILSTQRTKRSIVVIVVFFFLVCVAGGKGFLCCVIK